MRPSPTSPPPSHLLPPHLLLHPYTLDRDLFHETVLRRLLVSPDALLLTIEGSHFLSPHHTTQLSQHAVSVQIRMSMCAMALRLVLVFRPVSPLSGHSHAAGRRGRSTLSPGLGPVRHTSLELKVTNYSPYITTPEGALVSSNFYSIQFSRNRLTVTHLHESHSESFLSVDPQDPCILIR